MGSLGGRPERHLGEDGIAPSTIQIKPKWPVSFCTESINTKYERKYTEGGSRAAFLNRGPVAHKGTTGLQPGATGGHRKIQFRMPKLGVYNRGDETKAIRVEFFNKFPDFLHRA